MTAMVVNEADGRPAFRVAVFGMAQKFQRILEIVLKHARHNQYRYVVTPSRGPGDYDIAMVDMTAKGGYEVATTLKRLPSGRPIITVGRRNDPARGRDDLLQATFTMDVLKALNGVVEQQYTRARRPVVWLQDPPRGSETAPAAQPQWPQPQWPQQHASSAQPAAAAAATASIGPSAPPPTVSSVQPTGLAAVPGARLPAHALVIDDSPTVRRQLAVALSQIGVTSETVDNAKAALAAMGRFRYDIVFVDVVMPDMDGLRLIREIKRDRAARDMPIVILTSRSSPFDLARGALAGCSSYLVKPVSLKTLHTTVQRHLERQLARRRQAAETHPA
ncbi:MAG TPA: response regulator [Burkholderiaceae bacterium]|nr:response regulator [Burkholderiaceae bacterium]